MNSVVLVESRAKLRFGSNRTAPKIWQERQHDLHSPPQPIDWRERTIGAVHHRNFPTRSLQVPESYENFLWHRVKVRSMVTGLHSSRWWARWRSQSSSCQHHVITWRGLIPAEYLDSVAWPCHDCEVAPVWHHDVTNAGTCLFSAVCLTVFPFEFRPRTFTIGFYGKNSIISELNPIPTRGGGGGTLCPPPPRYTSSNISGTPWATDLKLSDNLNELN